MQKSSTSEKVRAYIRLNWFKLVIIGLVIFVFLQKDLSLQFNLNSPIRNQQELAPPVENVNKSAAKQKTKPITENAEIAKGSVSLMDRMGLNWFGKKESTQPRGSEFPAIDEAHKEAYIHRFAHVAINERKKFGIPSSVILANAMFHSFAGQRDMAYQGNNHFAIPCTPGWTAESGTYNDACYRHYENAWTSFRDHSLYLTSKHSNLLNYGSADYKGWVKEMEKLGYSEFPNLAKELIQIIEKYELNKLDFE